MECIILVGIPATGKTEYYLKNFFKTHVRINLDMLKTRKKEEILVNACILARQSFVVDNTNPKVLERKKYIDKAHAANFKTICYYFESTLDQAIIRNDKRKGMEKVPIVAIKSILSRLEIPNLNEGYDEVYAVTIAENNKFVVIRKF